ncbi:hypothetical protein B0I00_2755 [Novosphingobium kunmingense]|uniref:Uncharacterized protein n=1 Tax=Novosphingobium kunmingense TaxID=1211806 RepID=A0A2N0H5C7_9SPHN|nr:hypothetical protein [Novosphingobium kunmingense]PKB14126.1 hypothetical protein B0I00_2755 [Novosphingobium kunmingense]
MRYVVYAFCGLGMLIAWMNLTVDGARAKKHLLHAEQPAAYSN